MRWIRPDGELDEAVARRIQDAARALAAMSPSVAKSISIMQLVKPEQVPALAALVSNLERIYSERASIEGYGSVTVRFERGDE